MIKHTQPKDPGTVLSGAPGRTGQDRYTAERDEAIARTYRMIVSRQMADRRLNYEALLEEVARSPAPGYYVSYAYALRKVKEIISFNNETDDGEMYGKWAELAHRAMAEAASGGIGIDKALSRVLASGTASSYFIGKWGVKRALQNHRRRMRRSRRGGQENQIIV